MGDSGGPDAAALGLLFQMVGSRLASYDGRLEPALADETLWVAEPATGWPVTLGLAGDGRGNTKLFASARVDRTLSRVVGANLGRMLGMVQVLPVDDGSEVRRWSPYRIEDIERTPQEAVDWSASTMETMLEELRARGRAPVPAPQPEPPREYSFEPTSDDSYMRGPGVQHPGRVAPEPVITAPIVTAPSGDAALIAAMESRIADYGALNAAVQAELVTARNELAQRQELLDAALEERDVAEARARELAASAPVPAKPVVNPVPKLISAFGLLVEVGTRASTCIEVLRRFLDIAPEDPRLLEELGIYLLRDDQVPEALSILGDLGADGLTPRGASALVEASFRQRALPSDIEILGRVDWRMGNVATYLRDLPGWAPRAQLLDVTEVISQGAPPEFEGFLQSVARTITTAQLERLFSIWFNLDAVGSLDQLLDWLTAQRVALSQAWVRDAIELAAADEDRRIARKALDLLVDDAADRRDADALLGLVDAARDRLKASDWRTWSVRWLREAASSGGTTSQMDRCGSMTLDVLRDLPAVREEDAEYALAAVLEPKVTPALALALRSELDRLRPVDITIRDVTTVSEALKAAGERHAGLVVLAEAERSAAKRGTVGVAKAREALFALGEIADRYAGGELGEGLDDALATLPGYKPDVSDSAKNQYRQDYLRTLPDKRKVMLGPHCDIGGGDAGRVYFAIDRERRRIIVGHLGHLRGKRDT